MTGRRGVGRVLAAALVAVLGVCAIALAASPAQAVGGDWQGRMLAKVNAIRAEAGVRPVRLCPRLGGSAQSYAQAMADARAFGHDGVNGTHLGDRIRAVGYRATVAGENLGAGQLSVVQVVRQWRNSPDHLAILTDPRFRHVGFGFVSAPRGAYPTYWVQHFGVGGSC